MRSRTNHARRELRSGVLYELAQSLGLEIDFERPKNIIRCPFHRDRHASAFVSRDNVFYCSVCTPNGGMTAREFALRNGLEWFGRRITAGHLPPIRPLKRVEASFTAEAAKSVWEKAKRRAIDEVHDEDSASYEFVRHRKLERAWNAGELGFIGPDCDLKCGRRSWFDLGCRLVVPLFDLRGELVNVEGRNVLGREPRLLFPTGSTARGVVFANPQGRDALRGNSSSRSCVLAEGLTDFLALSTVPGLAVLSAPGAGVAKHAIGAWAAGCEVVLALDNDKAGEAARGSACQAAYAHGATSVRWIEWPTGFKDACHVLDRSGGDGLERFFATNRGEVAHG